MKAIIHLLLQHFFSQLAGKIARCKIKWFKNFLIQQFIKFYHVDLSEAEKTTPDDYPHFNAFFTRQLNPSARLINMKENIIISPADSILSQKGEIENETLIQAKGMTYTLTDLLAHEADAENFTNGSYSVFYLSPKDYHRVHMPFNGKLMKTRYLPGRLFPVKSKTVQTVPHLFARNERLICFFENEKFNFAVIFVGALLVSGIQTNWAGRYQSYQFAEQVFSSSECFYQKGDEIGLFEFGSTVILLFENRAIKWCEHLNHHLELKMGMRIAEVIY